MSDQIRIKAGVKAYPMSYNLVLLAVHTDAKGVERLLNELDVETECTIIIAPSKYTAEELKQAELEAQKLKVLFDYYVGGEKEEEADDE